MAFRDVLEMSDEEQLAEVRALGWAIAAETDTSVQSVYTARLVELLGEIEGQPVDHGDHRAWLEIRDRQPRMSEGRGNAIIAALSAVAWVAWFEDFALMHGGIPPPRGRLEVTHIMALRRLELDPCRVRHWFYSETPNDWPGAEQDNCIACGKWIDRKEALEPWSTSARR